MALPVSPYCIQRGRPLPPGPKLTRGGINFSIYSRHATWAQLRLFAPGATEPFLVLDLDRRINKTGDLWHVFVGGLEPPVEYTYRMDMRPNPAPHRHRFNPDIDLLDPYAREISGDRKWGFLPSGERKVRRSLVFDDTYDWEDDQPLEIPLADSVIYEMHVRGFTRHRSSNVTAPGTFRGVVEQIPYLKSLGITAVELLPVFEFEEADTDRINPLTGENLLNFWGYHPISFFAVNAAYSSDLSPGGPTREFRDMVKALHRAGLEVILDVVLNHTAEGDARGPTFSFRGIDNAVYYQIDRATGEYRNYSGCGNTVNCNHPVVRDAIADALRYWVTEMHVDGFRFDLASILGRGQDGSVLPQPPLLERLAYDPALAGTKLIAEAWDAAGLYQVGTFPAWGRWAEWNGKFRDDIRRIAKGDTHLMSALATRLTGSADLYQSSAREPYHSINFVTCHDGFTLADLVSYNEKHNEANGEGNRDGTNDNHSWNCGTEGPTSDPATLFLRERLQKNMAAMLFLSRGVPMMLGGDEFGRTQHGNNNAYCQDNETSWFDWSLAETNAGLLRFFRELIAFRHASKLLTFDSYTGHGPYDRTFIVWHGEQHNAPDWSPESRNLAVHLGGFRGLEADHLFLIFNCHWEPRQFELPHVDFKRWARKIDTSFASPHDILEKPLPLPNQSVYPAAPRSVAVLTAVEAPRTVRPSRGRRS
jgi:glycogen operon protein